MSEHLSAQHVERYHRRTMSSQELLAADDHIATCEACRRRLSEVPHVQAAFTSLRESLRAAANVEPSHLPYEQLAGYVDETLDGIDRELVESHLQLCRQCAADVRDLETFSATISVAPAKQLIALSKPTRWEGGRAFWRAARWLPIQIAATALVMFALLWTAFSLRRQVAELAVQVRTLQQTNDALQKQLVAVSDVWAERARAADLSRRSSPIVLELNEGSGRVTLDRDGNLAGLEAIPSAYREKVKTVLQTGRVETAPSLSGLMGKTGTLMSGSGEGVPFRLLSPVGTVVSANRPTFRWQPLPGATRYIVKLFDSSFKPVVQGYVVGTEWTPPRSLARGFVYLWQVTALEGKKEITSPTPPAPEARFRVLEQAKTQEFDRVRKDYANSHLVLGVLAAEAGLLEEAEREFQALVDANPRSPLAQALLREVKVLRQPSPR